MATSRAAIGATDYLFDNSWREAHTRLALLEEALDPATTRRISGLGVEPTWQCLEVGAGAGSIVHWLADRVPSGCVVAVDLDTRLLHDVDRLNVEVRQADVVHDDLERGAFDLVHARAVLFHLPERLAVLQKLVAALRPGGWLLLEEADLFPIMTTASGRYREVIEAFYAFFTTSGGAPDWARSLPQLLLDGGLDELGAEAEVPIFQGGSALARFWQLTLRQVRVPLLAHSGLGDEAFDRLLLELERPDCCFPFVAMVAAWARRSS